MSGDRVHYTFRVHQRPGTSALVLLNGVPIHDRTPDDLISPTGPITHALVPGENSIRIILLEAAPDPTGQPPHFVFLLERLERPDAVPVWKWEFPHHVREAKQDPVLPWVEEMTFTPQGPPPPEPAYAAAPPADFPDGGTPEQHRALRELYEAFERKDGDAFQDAMGVRIDEFERAYGANPRLRKESVDALQEPWVMDPWAPDDLRFERWLDGRVAFARRVSGRPAVRAVHRDEPFRAWGANLFLTQVGGRWRVFR